MKWGRRGHRKRRSRGVDECERCSIRNLNESAVYQSPYLHIEGVIFGCVLVELCAAMTRYSGPVEPVVFAFIYRNIEGIYISIV